MAPLVLEGDTLGSRHRHYNKLLKDAIAKNQQPARIDFDECDIDNFLQIDIASHNKDVEYILDVLRCEDMLYVNRAINRSTWLITGQQYAHIINPKYLHSQLFPQMTSKATNKLMLHVRLHIKDEKRAKDFHQYIRKVNPGSALKWLPLCSLDYIKRTLENRKEDDIIPAHILKRLCKKSIRVIKIYSKKHNYSDLFLYDMRYMLKSNFKEYLEVLESIPSHRWPSFGPKATNIFLKKCGQRVINDFGNYINNIDVATFVKYLKKDNIQDFLEKNVRPLRLQSFNSLIHFLRHFEDDKSCLTPLLKSLFDLKDYETDDRSLSLAHMALYHAMESIYSSNPSNSCVYRWYEFAPFEVAFFDLKKIIYTETNPAERNSLLELMLTCAGRNKQHIHRVLQYYHDKHINVPYKYKIIFVNQFLSVVDTYNLDHQTWTLLNAIFHSMEVYIESGNDVAICVDAIIVYTAIHNETVPEIVEEKFIFNSLKNYRFKLNHDDGEKLFTYLKDYLLKRLSKNIYSDKDLHKNVSLLDSLWHLFIDWQKEGLYYEIVLEKIRQYMYINREKNWNIDLSILYKMMKSWKRYLIAESILISPSDNVCVNALKYCPELLSRYRVEVEAMCCNDKVSLIRFLSKLRIYWPHSLAEQWAEMYQRRLDQPDGHRALWKGLYSLLPSNPLQDIIKKYAPEEKNIIWNGSNTIEISLRKQIAKNMLMARPHLPLDVVLLYAKGDYLQFAVNSLNEIFNNRYSRNIRDHFNIYIEAPVSLQKHGLRLALTELKTKELAPVLCNCWKATKNSSLRTLLFTSTFPILCETSKPSHIVVLWDVLKMFMDDLSCEENQAIYELLSSVSEVPISVRAEFYVRSYLLLKSLPDRANCGHTLQSVIKQASEHMEILDPDFILNILLAPVAEKFPIVMYTPIIASYLLCSKDEETQLMRYNNIMKPVMVHYFQWTRDVLLVCESTWDKRIKARANFVRLLKCLSEKMSTFVFSKKMVLPITMFADTYDKLKQISSDQEDYIDLTAWNLCVEFLKLLNNIMSNSEKKYTWNEIYIEAAPIFAKTCVQYLKEDMNRYFPSAYLLFESALSNFFNYFDFNGDFKLYTLESMVKLDNTIQTYLIVLHITPNYVYGHDSKIKEIYNMLCDHPSEEVKMNYYYHHEPVFNRGPYEWS